MTDQTLPLTTFYGGWTGFRQSLAQIVAPLTPAQLALPAAAHHWSIGMLIQHIAANRVWWFHRWMGAGNADLNPIADWGWGEPGHDLGTATELVAKLESSSQMIDEAFARWTASSLSDMFPQPDWLTAAERRMFPPALTRQWIIWHVIEHELLHGGELSVGFGANGLKSFYPF